jgi:hypothetical protein
LPCLPPTGSLAGNKGRCERDLAPSELNTKYGIDQANVAGGQFAFAPGELIKVQEFLNTWSKELGIEDFDTPESTEAWLRASGLWNGTNQLTQKQHDDVVNLSIEVLSSLELWMELLRQYAQPYSTMVFDANVWI